MAKPDHPPEDLNILTDPASASKGTKENLTPLMKQYEELKSSYPNEILLFRLGDFYEIFGEDARAASPVLEVVLTQRQGVPMCGVPHHAMARYISKLLKKNFRVAIAEQMEDPSVAKGIVPRRVVRVISPGTILEENLLNEKSNNFLLALAFDDASLSSKSQKTTGLAALDISTGQFILTEIEDTSRWLNLSDEVSRINPAEILLCKGDPPQTLPVDGFPLQWIEK